MKNSQWIYDRLTECFPKAHIEVLDTRGDDQHLSLIIKDQIFQDKTLVQRHQMIYKALNNLREGQIHALSIEAKPE